MLKTGLTFSLLSSLVLLTGCAQTDSDNIKTKGISAQMRVIDDNSSATSYAIVETTLYSGSGIGGTELKLTDGDRLVVYADGEAYGLKQVDDFIRTYYSTRVPNANINTEYRIAFERDEDTSADNSTIMLPDEFSIETEQNQTVGLDEETTIQWSPSGEGTMSIRAELECETNKGDSSNTGSDSTSDTGVYTFKGRDFLISDGTVYRSCEGTIYLERKNSKSVDSNFGEGGTISGIQRRGLNISFSTSG